jgi:hypothetical protein
MVACDDDRIFPSKIDPLVGWARIRSYIDYAQSRCTRSNFDSLPEARQLRDDARILSQQSRSVRLVYTQFVGWARMKCHFDYILSRCTQGSFIFCHKHGKSATMLAFAPYKFDLFVWF